MRSNDYLLLDGPRTSSDTIFSAEGEHKQTGYDVPKTEERNLWFSLDMPTTVSTAAGQKFTLTITAGEEE